MKPKAKAGMPAGKRPSRPALSVMIRPDTLRDPTEHEPEAGQDEEASARRPAAAADLAFSVGWEIRSLRLSINMTAQDLARKAGVSNGMISKLENGQATASFATLHAIAGALNVPVARLFVSHEKRADYSLVRAGRGINVRRKGAKQGLDYQLIGHLLSGEKFVEPYLVTIDTEAAPNPGFQHTGIEFMYMLEGRMTFRYADDLIDLGAGDTVVFHANVIHGHEKLLEGPVRYLSVVFNLRS